MATLEEETAERERLRNSVAKVTATDPKSLIRRDALGELNFEEAIPDIARIVNLFCELERCSFDEVPFNRAKQLADAADTVMKLFDQIIRFSIQQGNASVARTSLLTSIRSNFESAYNTLTPFIAYSTVRKTDFVMMERNARTQLEKIQSAMEEQAVIQGQYVQESEAVLKSIQKAAAEVGVSQHCIYFKLEAEEHSKAASHWLLEHILKTSEENDDASEV
jgi:hypothetical protein